jgi:cellulose biosynthesis protein BcsQ
MGKIVSVFSHKVGVGKTTFVHNLAFELSGRKNPKNNKKLSILLIDADSQMNLTACIHGLSTAIDYKINDGEKWNDILLKYKSFTDFLKENDIIPIKPREMEGIKNKKAFSFEESVRQGKIQFEELSEYNIHILSSSVDITEAENTLYNFDGNEDRPAKFQKALLNISKNYDYVIIDTSPSASSTLNALLVHSSDYLIVPVFPTLFSKQAVDNLKNITINWTKRLEKSEPYGFETRFKSLGIVVQMAKRYKRGEEVKTFAKHANEWMRHINLSVRKFQEEMYLGGRAISANDFQLIFSNNEPFIIEKFCDFTPQLRSASEKCGVPTVALNTQNDKKTKQYLQIPQYKKAFEETKKAYSSIANGLLKLDGLLKS